MDGFGRAPASSIPSAQMARRYDTVSLLTDYGWEDEFVGVVKSVLRDLAPHATAIDITHGVRPFDVRGGSLALARAIPYVAEGVVVAVVDPGVGPARRAVAVEVAGGAGVLVGPDNGLLAPAVAIAGGAERAVELANPRYQLDAPGSTFAGRDVFAPAAAHLCNEVDITDLGPAIDPYALLPGMVPLPREEADGIHAEVLWVDRFGNCQLNVGPEDLPAGVESWRVRRRRRDPGGPHRHRLREPVRRRSGPDPRLAGRLRPRPRPSLCRRRARHRRRRLGDPLAARRRRAAGDRLAGGAARSPVACDLVRPATTLAIGLLLLVILLAGVIALIRL